MSMILILLLSCLAIPATCSLDYDHSFDPRAHSEPGRTNYHVDLDSLIDQALASPSVLTGLYYHYRVKHSVDHGNEELAERIKLFREHLVKVQRLRDDPDVTWKAGITFMGDLTENEKTLLTMGNRTDHLDSHDTTSKCGKENKYTKDQTGGLQAGNFPASFDWRALGAVTDVRDQGETLDCWAHTAVTVMEAWMRKLTLEIDDLSTQELADCVYKGHDSYAIGGWPQHAWEYVKNEKRIGYKYQIPARPEGESGSCSYHYTRNALEEHMIQMDEIVSLNGVATKADDYMDLIHKFGPVAVNVFVDDELLECYTGLGFDPRKTDCRNSPSSFLHAMPIVGYDRDYFYMKNSWGADWGNDGYLWWVRAPGIETCGLYDQGAMLATMRDVEDESYWDD